MIKNDKTIIMQDKYFDVLSNSGEKFFGQLCVFTPRDHMLSMSNIYLAMLPK